MPEEFALKIVNDLAKINYKKRLSFFCGNEPLLDPRIEGFIGYAHEKLPYASITLVSNGDLASEKVLKRLFDSGMQRIIFSLHSNERKLDLEKYQTEFGKDRITISNYVAFKHFHNFGGLIKSENVSQERYLTVGCALPFKQLVAYSDCTVGLCCVDMAEKVKAKVPKDKSIIETFYFDEKLNHFRNMLACDKRDLVPCSECSYKGSDYLE